MLPTPCARDGKGPGHPYGLPDLIEPGGSRNPLLPTPTAVTYGSNKSVSAGATCRPGLAQLAGNLLPTPTVADSRSSANATAGRSKPMVGHVGHTLTDATRLLPTPRASDGHGICVHGDGGADLVTAVAALGEPDEQRWGVYALAVARWEVLLGRPVPEPTQPGKHGQPVLAPPFVEWLMGLDQGWVTDLDLPRTAALRVLGNGVVWQQAAVAFRILLCPNRWARE